MHCSKSTITDFIHRFDAYDRTLLQYSIPKDITNEQIHELLYKQKGVSKQESLYREQNFEQVFKALKLKGQDYSRYDLFEREEKRTLLPLPKIPFELMEREMTKVRKDLSVFFDRNNYSMVKKHHDKRFEVKVTSKTIYKAGTDVLLK